MKKHADIDPKDNTIPCSRCNKTTLTGAIFNLNNRGFRTIVCRKCLKAIWKQTSDKNIARRKRYNEMQRTRMEALYLISPAKYCPAPEGQQGQWMHYKVNLGSVDGPVVIYCPKKGLEASLATTRKRMSEGMHKDTECTKFFIQSFITKLSSPLGGGLRLNGSSLTYS